MTASPEDTADGPPGRREDVAEAPKADWFSLAAAARSQQKSLPELMRVLRRAVRLVWTAAPRLMLLTSGLQAAGALLLVTQLALVRVILDRLIGADRTAAADPQVIAAVLALAFATAASGLVAAALPLWQRLLGELTVREVWRGILDVTSRVDLATFERSSFFDHLERVRISAIARPVMIGQGIFSLIGGLLGSIGIAAALIAIQPALLPALLLAGVPLWLTSRRSGHLEFDFVANQTPALRARDYLADLMTGRDEAKEIRAFGLARLLRHDYETNYESYIGALRLHVTRRLGLATWASLTSASFMGLTVALLLWMLFDGAVTLGEAGTALLAVRMLASRITLLFEGMGTLFESGLFLADFEDFLRRGHDDGLSPQPAPTPFRHIVLNGVRFRYPGAAGNAIDGIDMTVERGQVIAIVGENGSGKTTLAKLMAGLYQPTSGTVCWDGTDINDLDPAGRSRQTSVIFQDFIRYQLTARQNIGLGRPDAVWESGGLREAANAAGALGFIDDLPSGLDTLLSKEHGDGVDLSLGQWQRIALARAFYRDAPFVILDEPTSSLDARAEHDLFESLRKLLAGRTVVLISHRFATVRTADDIYVMQRGRIVEHGRHEALMSEGGLYADLFRMQAAAYLPPPEGP